MDVFEVKLVDGGAEGDGVRRVDVACRDCDEVIEHHRLDGFGSLQDIVEAVEEEEHECAG